MTSLEVAYDPSVLPFATGLATPATEVVADMERPWNLWVAKGRARDLRLHRRMGWIGTLIALWVVFGVVWTLTS